ncbi:hypothetical protein SDRG_04111 [Saprolegnia diclina VS20]|uniref:Uncharacterized protein n=1 Tax=Saprolegnia diclina (strain VS20) TaxID=1156394 RepID=T0QWK4_SAPDV|nr:hypothetical protein SDRG_04111 [Saprolegnia diclina VS20]EQC38400.1 hypothetical protein SDRG_04111 [Saprolegnia diclina VS20]|eukprot:XP_008607992.1 hypothetical protein SDRG_04111 [Saprolegnia diclina VS20]
MVLQRLMTSMLLRVRTRRSSTYSADKSEKAQSIERSATVPPRTVLLRLVLNSSEFLLVVLFVSSIGVLYLTGLWKRQLTTSLPAFARDWSLLEANCVLTTAGFDAMTCTQTRAITGAMHSIAQTLVQQLPSTPMHVTTCVMGANAGFGAILLLFSLQSAPPVVCVPSSVASPVLGLALLETAMNNSTPVFLLSSYMDSADSAIETRIDSSGAMTRVAGSVTKTLFTPDGQTASRSNFNHSTWPFVSHPLGPRYEFTYRCVAEVLVDTTSASLKPVFTGVASSKTLQVGWTCSHTVARSFEISILQAILVPTILHLVNGDFFLTLVGWNGVLHRHPALTFDFVSGLERRRLALVLLVLVRLPSLAYVEVTRLYLDTTGRFNVHCIAVLMMSGLPVFAIYCCILVLQRMPTPPCCRGRAIRILSPLLMLGTLFSSVIVSCGYQDVAATLQNPLWRRPVASDVAVYMPNIGNRSEALALGAFASLEVQTAASLLQSTVLACLFGSLGISILVPMLRKRRLLLDMRYFARNEYLATQFMPSYVTGLPLYEDDCIKYGAKIFAKPSTIALLGHAMVKEAPVTYKIAVVAKDTPGSARDASVQAVNSAISIISVYDLVPSMLPHALIPLRVVAWIDNYQYKPAPPNTTLSKTTSYRPTKGSCVS